MFILDKPYVSDLLKNTLEEFQIPVLNTSTAQHFAAGKNFSFIDEDKAIKILKADPDSLLYTNSENAILWIINNMSFSDLPQKIDLFKNKFKFRELLKTLYPDYYYIEVSVEKIDHIDIRKIPFPFIIKPSVGFFSLGVHKVMNESEWGKTKIYIQKEIDTIKDVYPREVLNIEKFIIEENIEGDEYAFDAYYNAEGKPVILSILKHLFSSDGDVYDRIYISSKEIIESNIERFLCFLQEVGKLANLKNFPLHVEVRVDKNGKLMPIEINPLRTGGWCTTADMTWFAFGFNPYEYIHFQKVPDWANILKDKKGKIYSNIVLNNSTGMAVDQIHSFDYDRLLTKFENPLELRKANFKQFLIFGFLFAETREDNFQELEWILHSDLKEFINI